MWCLRIGGCVTGLLVFTAATAFGQDSAQPAASSSPPGGTVVQERTEIGVLPLRRTEARTPSGSGHLLVEIVETPGIEGRWQVVQQTTTQTTNPTPNVTRVTSDIIGTDLQHEPVLLGRTESEQVRTSDNGTQMVTNASVTDINNRLGLVSQQVEQHTTAAGTAETNTHLLQPNIDSALAETVRVTYTERPLSAANVRQDSSILYRDINGQWRAVQTQSVDLHRSSASEQVDEETIARRDMNDTLGMAEKNVTRRTVTNGREDSVVERYVPRDPDAIHRSDSRLDLSERVHVITTVAPDGTRETVEEVEGRSLVSASDPLRVRRRVVTTVRPSGADASETVRQVFDLDVNGRMVLTATVRETNSAR